MSKIKIVSDGKGCAVYSEDGVLFKSVVAVEVKADMTGCFAYVTFVGPELDITADIKEKKELL